ncbi:GntR family transcriptional regulator [Aquabacter spiritensis]|uniref:GntR family transcriptional regulator n=1 Tax=Aquabacter spiritensis TaxID=933073 RepID=A0A4R3M3A1_9HYPH|nr:GntR family transcriptional regulator [Aquabacter spiritensis]TCT07704.1 GntR family transcriptional regulator [Aquabacter spiritensis]
MNVVDQNLSRIEREPLWDRAHTQLREALLAGRFEPGSALVLRQLADTFGTSITPVRDALSRLVAQRVLEQGPRNSALVPDVRANALKDLMVVRCELEGRAAREAALKADAAGLEALEALLAEMRGMIAKRRLDTYLDVHRRFHFGVYAMSGIAILVEMIENLWLRCGPVLSFVVPEYVLSLKGTDHHAALLAAIRAGDGARAEAEIIADIEEAGRYLLGLADTDGRIRRAG